MRYQQTAIAVGDVDGKWSKRDLVVDFGTAQWHLDSSNNASGASCTAVSVQRRLVVRDLDGNGSSRTIIVGLRSAYGRLGFWQKQQRAGGDYHTVAPKGLAIGDVDGNGLIRNPRGRPSGHSTASGIWRNNDQLGTAALPCRSSGLVSHGDS
jgi:hypothetical protein